MLGLFVYYFAAFGLGKGDKIEIIEAVEDKKYLSYEYDVLNLLESGDLNNSEKYLGGSDMFYSIVYVKGDEMFGFDRENWVKKSAIKKHVASFSFLDYDGEKVFVNVSYFEGYNA